LLKITDISVEKFPEVKFPHEIIGEVTAREKAKMEWFLAWKDKHWPKEVYDARALGTFVDSTYIF